MGAGTLLIFGGGGFVGGHLAARALQSGWSVLIADLLPHDRFSSDIWRQVDITSREAVENLIYTERPRVAVNLAALADIDRAERERELAWQINVQGAGHVAEACSNNSVRHIYFSSDAVFDGEKGPYIEEDVRNPVNYYGITKVEGEDTVSSRCPEGIVVRISLVLGFPVARGNSFLSGLADKLQHGVEIAAPVDEVRTPVDVLTLAECVMELATISVAGVLHIGCTQSIDRYSLTRLLAHRMGYPEYLVVEQKTGDEILGRAPRHKKGRLDVSKAQIVLKTTLPDLDTTVQKALSTWKSIG
jgi:dTDP-4-dehydrorhamnose reductase